jgi:hypothetical protein
MILADGITPHAAILDETLSVPARALTIIAHSQ